jgi:hypothetical protein
MLLGLGSTASFRIMDDISVGIDNLIETSDPR